MSNSSPTRSKSKTAKKGGRGQRKSSSLPSETVEYLKAWMMSPEHIAHPYPTEPEKAKIMTDTGIELKQLTNWFVNNRKRYWKPRVEARLQQQAQAAAAAAQAHAAAVAAVTAASHTNLVSPVPGAKPTLTVPPGNGFVTFDLCTTASDDSSSESYPHLVGTDLSRVLADKKSSSSIDARAVSETSSSSSVSTSEEEEEELSDSSPEDNYGREVSTDSVADTTSLQEADDGIEEQPSGESSSSQSSSYRPLYQLLKRSMEQETVQTPRKKFRRVSLELWRESCQKAESTYDEGLPSLEEATQLFGYSY